MTSTIPIRGSFTVVGSGEFQEFMFNPNAITDRMGPNYAAQDVPGISFPTLSYGGGQARTVSFDLFLFESGIRRPRPANAINTKVIRSEEPRNPLDLTDDIKFYQSLTQPQSNYQEGRSFEDKAPPVLLFNFGPMYQGWPCVLDPIDVRVTKFSPNLEPLEATLSIVLRYKPSVGETRANYFRSL